MRFHGQIEVFTRVAGEQSGTKEIYADYFKAKSIQSAKAKLTRLANDTELFSWIQSWDKAIRAYTGKDVRWRSWTQPNPYTQKDGTEIAWAVRSSESVSGERIYDGEDRYGKSVTYRVDLTLRWAHVEETST